MSSLLNASPELRNYFKKHYIPQVCEALLCGLLISCPDDPLRYLEAMLIFIMENGLEHLIWDMCIDPAKKPAVRRLSETYLEQLFGFDDQLMTPELMIKACTFYTGNIVRTHFCSWRDLAIPPIDESEIWAKKMEMAIKHDNFRCQRSLFLRWHFYVQDQKNRLIASLQRLQALFYNHRLIITLTKWKEKARKKYQTRENQLMLQHELQLQQWHSKMKLNLVPEEYTFLEDLPESVITRPEFDISQLPDKAIARIFFHLTLRDVIMCGQVSHSWMLMTQKNVLWNSIDFSLVRSMIPDKYIVSILQRWKLNVLRLNFRGCAVRTKTLRAISHCKNLQELNVSDCPTLTDESMRCISECCTGVLYLNLSNTLITNRTMRLLPRHFHNLQNLSLAYCRKFTDKGLQYLSLGDGCHKLLYLDLSGCTQISVKGFKNIANSCTGIRHLTINDMPTLTDNCVKALVDKCSHITSVIFMGAPHISDSAFKALTACRLRKIRVEGNKRITDACFKNIDKTYPNIHHIYLSNCRGLTDGSLKSLSPLKQLCVLNLTNCIRIGDIGLRLFLDGPAGTRIRELNLSNCSHLGDLSVMKLSESCPNLNYLSLRNCEHLTNVGIEYVANIFSLISVDLSGTRISNETLTTLSRHKKLKELSLAECYNITDVGVRNHQPMIALLQLRSKIIQNLMKAIERQDMSSQAFCRGSLILESLDVSYCSQLTSDIIKALAIYCIHLTFLSIAGCPKITDSAMEILSAKCHYLHILDISGCVLFTDKMLEHLKRGCKQLRILKMQYCTRISQEAAKKMSTIVQQQEYSSDVPPAWFGYDNQGNPLTEQDTKSAK